VTLPTSGQTRKRQQLAPSLQAASTTRPLPGRLSSHETISSNDWHFPPPPSSLACEEVSEASLEWRAITASGALPVLLLRKESAFQKWATQGLSNTEIDGLFGPRRKPPEKEFPDLCATPRAQHFRDLRRLNQRNVIPQAPFRSRSVLVPPPVAVLSSGAGTYNPRGIPKVTRQKPPRGRERPRFALAVLQAKTPPGCWGRSRPRVPCAQRISGFLLRLALTKPWYRILTNPW